MIVIPSIVLGTNEIILLVYLLGAIVSFVFIYWLNDGMRDFDEFGIIITFSIIWVIVLLIILFYWIYTIIIETPSMAQKNNDRLDELEATVQELIKVNLNKRKKK